MTKYRAADMAKWTAKAKRNVALVVKQSIQDVSEIAQTPKAKGGRLPVDKGFLRNSYSSGLNGSTSLTGPAAYVATVAGMEMGDTFSAGWTVAYARRVHSGFVGTDSRGRTFNQQGAFFMEEALMQWQAINDRNAAKIAGD
ncbi:hypothetical protein [Oceaniglobus trochenteri]|uniref:hypothetical protein n=1 Tax=Oceaniglobus trochenteri TaxID=2763260 RepID=UPI001CFFAF93|nr:hypothetical protein [Oceaniglobus trochenteri]